LGVGRGGGGGARELGLLNILTFCRIQRDVACRGRDIGSVIEQYTRFVKPSFDNYVAPSRRHADVILPWVK